MDSSKSDDRLSSCRLYVSMAVLRMGESGDGRSVMDEGVTKMYGSEHMGSVDINERVDDLTADELIEDRPLKRSVWIGLALFAVSMAIPGASRTGGWPISEFVSAVGAWCIVIPLIMVSWHQFRTKRHFGVILHLVFPVIGAIMVAARVVLVPLGVSPIFLNVWSIGGTFLIFPLVQQLIDLLSGSVDMENGGRQVRYQE